MKDHIPDQYKGVFDMGVKAYDGAVYLKQKKDELQLQMCEKVVDQIWSQFDTEDTGYISKSQCEDLAKQGLEKAGKAELFQQMAFDKVFEQVDAEKNGKITK